MNQIYYEDNGPVICDDYGLELSLSGKVSPNEKEIHQKTLNRWKLPTFQFNNNAARWVFS